MARDAMLPKNWDLPEAIRSRLGDRAGRQRLMNHEDHLLVILHAVPTADDRTRRPVFFWRNPDGDWKTSANGAGLAALKDHVQSYIDRVTQLDKALELAIHAKDYYQILSDLAPVSRAASHLAQVLQSLREAIKDDKRIISLRDEALDAEREGLLLMEEARNAMDFAIARQAEEQARQSQKLSVASHRLNLLVALFLPATALAALFGMNLPSGLESAFAPVLFWLMLLVGMILGVVVAVLLTPRHR